MDEIVDVHHGVYKLPPDVAAQYEECAWLSAQTTTSLGNYFHPRAIYLFHYTPKMHYLIHIGLLCKHINPQQVWCFLGEDLMYKIARLMGSCLRGSMPSSAIQRAMKKYAAGLDCLLMQD